MKLSLPFLQSFGLTENEISLYELLLKLGKSPASTIIYEAKLKRPTVYKTLYSLEKKGLVEQKKAKTKIHFSPLPPTALAALAEIQYQELDRSRENLLATLPALTSLYISAVERPIVKVFEGLEGLKQIYEDTLSEGQPIYAVLQAAQVQSELYGWLTKTYVKKRIKHKIHAKVIVASSKESTEYTGKDIEELRTTRIVSSSRFPLQHEVDIYGENVAFLNYKHGEKLLGIVIKHPLIAQTMKAWFELAWKGAEK